MHCLHRSRSSSGAMRRSAPVSSLGKSNSIPGMVKLLGESCRVVDGSGAPDWPKSTLAILILSLLEWTGCRYFSSHRCKAKLKHSSSAARTDYVDYNHCSCKCPFVYHRVYNDCTCKTQRPLTSIRWTDQNNSIHSLCKNINIVTMPTCDVLLRHFRQT